MLNTTRSTIESFLKVQCKAAAGGHIPMGTVYVDFADLSEYAAKNIQVATILGVRVERLGSLSNGQMRLNDIYGDMVYRNYSPF